MSGHEILTHEVVGFAILTGLAWALAWIRGLDHRGAYRAIPAERAARALDPRWATWLTYWRTPVEPEPGGVPRRDDHPS